jgi:hypothetical protein
MSNRDEIKTQNQTQNKQATPQHAQQVNVQQAPPPQVTSVTQPNKMQAIADAMAQLAKALEGTPQAELANKLSLSLNQQSEPVVPRQGFEANVGYVKQNRGFPVQPGQTWRDLTHAQRVTHMKNHENRWKAQFAKAKEAAALGATMDWTRG